MLGGPIPSAKTAGDVQHFCGRPGGLRGLSGTVFVSFERVECSVPSVGKVEDRHIEHKHRIVPSAVRLEYFPPFLRKSSSRSFHSCFSVSKELELITIQLLPEFIGRLPR